ncbi:DUF2141 domain-containing protein [Azospirillum oleiclasticum]|nr:DUF2141 domain-containing protein [Azospirillum oleiclasticum]
MKTVSLMVALVLFGTAAPASAGELRATVRNVKPEQGRVMVGVFDTADGFRKDRRLVGQMLVPAAAEVTAVFTDLPAGRYVVAVYQDLNGNESLDRSILGMPTEPYGFSRDAVARFGPPAFEEMALELGAAPVATVITLTP